MNLDKRSMYLLDTSKRRTTRFVYYLIVLLLLIASFATDVNVKEDKEYGDLNHVVMYLYEFGNTPSNYVPKYQSNRLEGEELYLYSTFQNREKLLPLENTYKEVYINAVLGNPGAQRLVYSEDTIYYTEDHYESFKIITTQDILLPHRVFNIILLFSTLTYPTIILVLRYGRKTLSTMEIKEDFMTDFDYLKMPFRIALNKLKKDKTV
jgi:hypothetical protein